MRRKLLQPLLCACAALVLLSAPVLAEDAAPTRAEQRGVVQYELYTDVAAIDPADAAYRYLLRLAQAAPEGTARLAAVGDAAVGAALEGNDAVIYRALAGHIARIAAGEETDTRLALTVEDLGLTGEWTAAELGVDALIDGNTIPKSTVQAMIAKLDYDINRVVAALMADYPYELYWYDKTIGVFGEKWYGLAVEGNDEALRIRFADNTGIAITPIVSREYAGTEVIRDGDAEYPVEVAPEKLVSCNVHAAVNNAKQIVAENRDKTDYKKLLAYKNKVCELASYNGEAGDESSEIPYGNPWQMIYVFDGDPNTSVVCEGYAKAFQYLCDLSEFAADVRCYSVTGPMGDSAGMGAHMWNVVRMGDGRNYMADVTNCDEGTIGADDLLFLTGCTSGSVENGYVYTCHDNEFFYAFDDIVKAIFGEAILTMSDTAYHEEEITASVGALSVAHGEGGYTVQTAVGTPETATAFFAAYGSDGRLLRVETRALAAGSTQTLNFTAASGAKSAKVMLIGGSCVPLCACAEAELTIP